MTTSARRKRITKLRQRLDRMLALLALVARLRGTLHRVREGRAQHEGLQVGRRDVGGAAVNPLISLSFDRDRNVWIAWADCPFEAVQLRVYAEDRDSSEAERKVRRQLAARLS